jgi:hypothetical protein
VHNLIIISAVWPVLFSQDESLRDLQRYRNIDNNGERKELRCTLEQMQSFLCATNSEASINTIKPSTISINPMCYRLRQRRQIQAQRATRSSEEEKDSFSIPAV